MNALLSSQGGEGGVTNDRQVERRNYCEASLFSIKERSRHGQTLFREAQNAANFTRWGGGG